VRFNPLLDHSSRAVHTPSQRTTTGSLTLPFFESFTGPEPYPDSNKWVDRLVYINNTMAAHPLDFGVATFDDLDGRGIPYDSFNNEDFRPADSLTSKPIDLSANTPADSVYLSFFYQPQGNGSFPLPQDSLQVFFKNRYGDYVEVWSVPGSAIQPFQQVMIPITDTLDFHSTFQFRFMNYAALYWADAVWNVDYIRLDKYRGVWDTTVSDVAFTSNPTFLLNDYTSMPYNQFMADWPGEVSSIVTDSILNDTSFSQSVNYGFNVTDVASSATLTTATPTAITLPGYATEGVSEPLTISSFPSYPANTSVVFQTQYYLESTSSTGITANDTITQKQVFDDYLAYDDGTAEKSYYLNLFPTLPGKIAVQYHLNAPDTLRGVSIYFGRQIPFAFQKYFYIYVYSAIAGWYGATQDVILDSIENAQPGYADSVNFFWTYTFPQPLIMPAGTFYMGTMQPAESGADSLYIGFDVNRIGDNHVFYNTEGYWLHSSFTGALMIRPILGHYVASTNVKDVQALNYDWQLEPNPATDHVRFEYPGSVPMTYTITDMAGRELARGAAVSGGDVTVSELAPGMYVVTLERNGQRLAPKKMMKL
jgi:hypothetical protein